MSNNTHRHVPFRVQRSLFAFVVFGLLGLYTLSVQWSHVDQIAGLAPMYVPLVKAGLASVEVVVCLLLIWELWARNHALTLACFASVILLEIVCVIHAGAILQLDTNRAAERQDVAASTDAQIRLATEMEKARIAATADAAGQLNRLGQRRTARQVAGTIGAPSVAPSLTLPPSEAPIRKSFLPAWYLDGGQYFVTILLAYVLFSMCFFVSRAALATEDEPLATDKQPEVRGTQPAPPVATSLTTNVPRPAVGFATSGNLQPVTAAKPESSDPKEPPRL